MPAISNNSISACGDGSVSGKTRAADCDGAVDYGDGGDDDGEEDDDDDDDDDDGVAGVIPSTTVFGC